MAIIRSITLSTGKKIIFGLWPFSDGARLENCKFGALFVATKRNGVYTILYNPYTKAEIRELRYIATGYNDDNFVWPPVEPSDNYCNYVVPIGCVMVNNQQTGQAEWQIRLPFTWLNNSYYVAGKIFSYYYADGSGGYINSEAPNGTPAVAAPAVPFCNFLVSQQIIATKYTGFYSNYDGTKGLWFSQSNSYVIGIPERMDEREDTIPGGGGISYDDDDNPYGTETSIFGGGDGDFDDAGVDDITKIDVPDVPSVSVTGCGFIKIYNPSKSQLLSLSSFLWSSAFDIDSFKKLFSDPMEAIIGLGVVPVTPSIGGSANVKFGDIDSGVSMPVVNNQYIQKSMGTVSVKKYVGCFMDYSPYTSIQIYLPYIGIRELSPDDVMNDTIQLDYNIDVLSGGCAALISTAKKGLLYQYNGSCIANIPLTAINYSGAIQNAVSALGSVATTVVGAVSGAAPLAAMGVAGLATSAANTAVNSKPQVQRSGSMGGAAGLMSSQKPYLIINRPRMSVPDKLNKFSGNTCNVTMKLSACTGFTMIDTIHLSGMKCTDNERDELMNILRQGVIF